MLLQTIYEIKLNGLEDLLRPLRTWPRQKYPCADKNEMLLTKYLTA
jgi:hypothetical protein